MNRRDFLTALGAVSAISLLPSTARACVGSAQNLIIVFAGGGWDTTYLFDAKPDSPYVNTGAGDWSAFGDGALWFDRGRPSVTSFFEAYGDRTVVINGLNVPSISHGSCTQRLLTGSRDVTRPDLAAIVGNEIGHSSPMPYLDIGGAARPGILGADMGFLGPRNQLGGLVRQADAPRPPNPQQWGRYFPQEEEFALIEAHVAQRAGLQAERGALGENARRYQAFVSGLHRSHDLRGFEEFFAGVGNDRNFAGQARIGVQALSYGLSRTLLLTTDGDFDTHQNNDDQEQMYEGAFAALQGLVDTLVSTPGRNQSTLLDETVVLVASEMGRTPVRNGDDGKDHWPITSCMLLGGGIQGGRILGGTDDALAARPIDLGTGAPSDGGVILQPEHIHTALLELLGIDPTPWFPNASALGALCG